MHISRERMKLVGREANATLGEPCSVNGDYSLAALLRATIIDHTEWSIESIADQSSVLMHRISRDSDLRAAMDADSYAIIICETRSGYFPSEFEYEGWRALDTAPYPISRYLSQFAKTRVFVNEEKHKVVVAVDRQATSKWVQGFMSTFPRMLTWYFTSELTSEEQAFFKAISVNNKDVSKEDAENIFVDYINKAADKIDFREMSLHKHLDGFYEKIKVSQLETYKNSLENTRRSISSYQSELSNLYGRLDNDIRMLRALEESPDETSGEIFEFFKSHKCLDIVRTSGDTIRFGVTETLEFYDEDEFNRVYRRSTSYLHSSRHPDVTKALKAIFSEHKGVFVTNAVFEIRAMRYVSMKADLSKDDVLPHPHIYFYQCSGGNDQYYSKYAESGEWQLAIEQAIGATKNINFGDATVGSRMVSWLIDNLDVCCIKLADSERVVSMRTFIEILKEGEKNNG